MWYYLQKSQVKEIFWIQNILESVQKQKTKGNSFYFG